MYSLNINYIFDKVYDFFLWFKYLWYFTILRYDNEKYLQLKDNEVWDGLRDRGWLTGESDSSANTNFISEKLSAFGIDLNKDTDGDGIPNSSDEFPFDPNNSDNVKLKSLFEDKLAWTDKIRDFFGLKIRDTDGDGLPDSVEKFYKTNINSPDTDGDGIFDSEEINKNMNALNADIDKDGVVDGRDAYPFDKYKSIFENDVDTDGDGVGDRFEKAIGTNIIKPDTDMDGIRDGIDPNPLMAENKINNSHALTGLTDGINFEIQNTFLHFLSTLLIILHIFTLPILIFVFYKWYKVTAEGLEHYYHMFHHSFGYKEVFGKAGHDHIEALKQHKQENAGNSTSHTISAPPEIKEYNIHPKWAIIKDYMSENSEVFWRMGIIEADTMLSEILTEKGVFGADLGEKLNNVRLLNKNEAWEAHKVRNKIAHEGSNFVLTERDAKLAFNAYERVFQELKVI